MTKATVRSKKTLKDLANDPAEGYKALGTLVMVREQEHNETTKGGIILTKVSQETQFLTTGIVLSRGRGYYEDGQLISLECEVGDRVLFARTSSNVWRDPGTGKDFMFIPASNLLAVVPKDV